MSDMPELKSNESDDDIDINSKRNKIGHSLSKTDKLSYFCAGKIDKAKDGSYLSMISIKTEVFNLSHMEDGCIRILETHDRILKERALSAAPVYTKKKVISKKGVEREVLVKEEFMAAMKWAKKPSSKGGGSTAYSVIERIVLIGAVYVVAKYPRYLKVDPALGITAAGNIGKVYRVYVIIMYLLEYGSKYPEYVVLRNQQSIRKKVAWCMDKKNMHPDAVNIRTILVEFASPKGVATSNCIKFAIENTNKNRSTPTPSTPTAQQKPTTGATPCFPVKKRRKLVNDDQSSMVLDKCVGLLKRLENDMDSKNPEMLDLTGYGMPASPSPATSTSTSTSTTTTTTSLPSIPAYITEEADHMKVLDFISQVLDWKEGDGITKDYKDYVMNMILRGWQDPAQKKHILTLIRFVSSRPMPRLHQLRILELDLKQLSK